MRRFGGVVMAVVVTMAAAAACSGGASDQASKATGSADLSAGALAEPAGATASAARAPAADTAATNVDTERIVYTADLVVRVEDPGAAGTKALRLVERAGGTLAAQEDDDASDLVTLTVRVPAARFTATLDELSGLGVELERRVSAEEVSEQVVDLDRRLANAKASADRLRGLYANAADVNQVVAIEKALTEREGEVEVLTGQLALLKDKTDRSTITVRFVDTGEPEVEKPKDHANAFVRGWRAGGKALGGLGRAVAAVGGFALPFLPILLVGGVLWAVLRPRLQRRRAAREAVRPVATGGVQPPSWATPIPPAPTFGSTPPPPSTAGPGRPDPESAPDDDADA